MSAFRTPPPPKGRLTVRLPYRCAATPARWLTLAELNMVQIRKRLALPAPSEAPLKPPQADRADAAGSGIADNEALYNELASYHGPF